MSPAALHFANLARERLDLRRDPSARDWMRSTILRTLSRSGDLARANALGHLAGLRLALGDVAPAGAASAAPPSEGWRLEQAEAVATNMPMMATNLHGRSGEMRFMLDSRG